MTLIIQKIESTFSIKERVVQILGAINATEMRSGKMEIDDFLKYGYL
jgi:hypothetical protein